MYMRNKKFITRKQTIKKIEILYDIETYGLLTSYEIKINMHEDKVFRHMRYICICKVSVLWCVRACECVANTPKRK